MGIGPSWRGGGCGGTVGGVPAATSVVTGVPGEAVCADVERCLVDAIGGAHQQDGSQ